MLLPVLLLLLVLVLVLLLLLGVSLELKVEGVFFQQRGPQRASGGRHEGAPARDPALAEPESGERGHEVRVRPVVHHGPPPAPAPAPAGGGSAPGAGRKPPPLVEGAPALAEASSHWSPLGRARGGGGGGRPG